MHPQHAVGNQRDIENHRPLLQQAYADYFSEHAVEAVVFPTTALLARKLQADMNTVEFAGEQVPTFPAYIRNTVDFLEPLDIISSLAKGAVFGFIATLMGCYFGMNSGRGAQGVGSATKSSVEAAAVLILAANFVLTGVFFSL